MIGELIAILDRWRHEEWLRVELDCHENSGWGPVDFLPSESVIHPFFGPLEPQQQQQQDNKRQLT